MDHQEQKFWKVQVYRGLELIFHFWRQAMTGEQMKYILHRMKISLTTLILIAVCLIWKTATPGNKEAWAVFLDS